MPRAGRLFPHRKVPLGELLPQGFVALTLNPSPMLGEGL
ncbi:hypothetical protein GFS31_02250 [Leptolyngbya sp. BL0902]|nr:hypothetical protein GFS31_02250 [Leptolyngbya sp. BL0902]